MKKLLSMLTSLLILLVACTNTITVTETCTDKTTQTVSITNTQTPKPTIGQLLDIPVEPTPQSYLIGKVLIQNTKVRLGNYDESNPIRTYTAGDPCLIVTGTITNEDDTEWQIGFFASGYSSKNSEVISRTLDIGPIAGSLGLILSAGQTREFKIHLEWNEDVNLIKISGSLYSTEVPLP